MCFMFAEISLSTIEMLTFDDLLLIYFSRDHQLQRVIIVPTVRQKSK